MRTVEKIWDTWRGGVYLGDNRPSTRVTVQRGWTLQVTEPVLGTWNRGPARWYQAEDNTKHVETELPNVVSVNINRAVDTDAGTCDIVMTNTAGPQLGQPETPAGQFGDVGHFTFDHGGAQDARARWGHVRNSWYDVLVPNALLRTYMGFGGVDKAIDVAVADGDLVLYGVWLIDDVTINTDGTLNIKCRDMAKLLIDQQIFPPLVPANLYPVDYRRWVYQTVEMPPDPAPPGDYCYQSNYWNSSTDQFYGEWNSAATGHPGSDAFDMSTEAVPQNVPGLIGHQRTYWLSEPKDGPSDTVWIELQANGGEAGLVNQIYYHAWKGAAEGRGCHRIMVSVMENGAWVAPETQLGGITPDGIPYVTTFVPGTEVAPAVATNLYNLPRDYRAGIIRLTLTNLLQADDFPYGFGDPDYHGGGWRGGARKIMCCYSAAIGTTYLPILTFAGCAIPVNDDNRLGYWQCRANGQTYAFGDARIQPINSPNATPASTVIGMAVHPDGNGYWIVDICGRVISAGSANWYGDLYGQNLTDVVDIAPNPVGDGYWLLRNDGSIHPFGNANHWGEDRRGGVAPTGGPNIARSLESHPTQDGYWVLWADGVIQAYNVAHHGDATDRAGYGLGEWTAAIRRTSTGDGYWVSTTLGRIHAFGDAPDKGSFEPIGYEGDLWAEGLVWDIIPSSIDDKGYAFQSADGHLWPHGDIGSLTYGSVGAGQATQRFDGNYKDYADIVKELLLWAGFYLFKDPQPAAEFPAVYGNVETTGAWAEDPLPKDMFDKRAIIEPIKQLKDIVGYITWVDPEGGFRFESPNWWILGNFLMDGTPFSRMPEIDEAVQLISHSITRSASQARSRLIISTQDPYPAVVGKDPAPGIVTTEIVPKTASDLRGLVVPAMWINGQFLRPDEQKIMADLVDMRMWFSRRTAQITCTANPLIDINDQVRVIERQTGDVYIHYVRGVSISHDLRSGDFRMNLTTYWLGGSPWGKFTIFYTGATRPQGDGYWTATIGGSDKAAKAGIYAYGNAQLYESNETDSHLESISAMRSTPSGEGYYTLDESGKVLTYGDAVHQGELHRGMKELNDNRPCKDVIDMALTPSGAGYWLLQKSGTVTAFGDATHYGNVIPDGKLPSGAEIFAVAIESHPTTQGYWVMKTSGQVHGFNLPWYGDADRLDTMATFDHFTCLRRTSSGAGYWITTGSGIVSDHGDATLRPGSQPEPYPEDQWHYGMYWDILTLPDDTYALLRADGRIASYQFPYFAQISGTGRQLLWALVCPEDYESLPDKDAAFGVSSEVMGFLARTASPSANNAVVSNFAFPTHEVVAGLS